MAVKFQLRYERKEGEKLPLFYGHAWWDYVMYRSICYPVPFNWVMWLAREIWLQLSLTPRTKRDLREAQLAIKAREAGYKFGYADGLEAGLARGVVEGRNKTFEQLEAAIRGDLHGTR